MPSGALGRKGTTRQQGCQAQTSDLLNIGSSNSIGAKLPATGLALGFSGASSATVPHCAHFDGHGHIHNNPSANGAAVKNEDLLSVFECPVCFDYAIPPLRQCQSGHMVCQTCRDRLNSCPTCRGPLGDIRNLAMEKVASTILFPCRFSNCGCSTTMNHMLKLTHEEDCEYRPYICPCPGAACRWNGVLEGVVPHLKNVHKSITTLQGEDIVFLATDITLPGAVDWVMMQACFGQYFILILEKQERIEGCLFYAVVQFIGNRKDANNFAYRLELNGNRRRLQWEATTKSIHDGAHQPVFSKDCLMFDAACANHFAENGNLGINVTISMVENSDSRGCFEMDYK